MAANSSASGGAMAELAPLTGATLIITAVALALGTFMQVLDLTIANVAVPTIVGDRAPVRARAPGSSPPSLCPTAFPCP